ncbi:MAG: PAS domain S-box protein [Magnetococcus sp. MYC-9]
MIKIFGKYLEKNITVFSGFVILSAIGLTVLCFIDLDSSMESNEQRHVAVTRYLEVLSQLRHAKTHFANQVHNWKNILLRGSNNQDDYKKYLAEFFSEEEQVQTHLSGSVALLKKFDTSHTVLPELKEVIREHLVLGEQYRNALHLFDMENHQASSVVDSTVRGIDRPATEKIDLLLDQMASYMTVNYESDQQRERYEYQSNIYKSIAYFVFVSLLVSVTVFVLLWNQRIQLEIARRMAVEDASRKNEHRLRNILNNTSSVVFMKDLQGRYLFVNRQYEELFHISNDSIQNKTDYDLFPPRIAEVFQANDRLALVADAPIQADETVPQDDGEHYYIATKFPLRDEQGQPYAVCGIATDITERKKAEDARAQSESYFRTLFEFSNDAVMLLDENGFFDCNAATLSVFGCAFREDFYRLHPSDLSPAVQPDGGDSLTLANQYIATALDQGSSRFDWIHRRTDGQEFPAEVLLSAVLLSGRKVILGVVRDITERKQAEYLLRQSKEQVEAASQEKSEMLATVKQHLQQIQRLSAHLDQVSESEKRRLADEFHSELGNDLAAAKLSLSILSKRQQDEADRQRCQEIYQLTDHALHSARRISRALRPVALDRMGVRAALEELVSTTRTCAGFECQLVGEEVDWPMDESQRTALFRIAQESLTNVIRHAGAKKVVIALREEQGSIVLEVNDDGCGIPDERVQADDSFGLASMRERAERLGGSLHMAAIATGGTRVTARIPLVTATKGLL